MRAPLLLLLAAGLVSGLHAQSTTAVNYAARLKAETAAETTTAYSVIFDTSGSMKGPKLESAKQAFTGWLQTVQPGNVWSLYKFNNTTCERVMDFTLNGQDKVAQSIRSFNADSNTPIVASLTRAFADIQKRRAAHPYETHIILLFTDGGENVDARQNPGVLATLETIRKSGIEVVAIGYAGEGDYMSGYASRFYQANDAKALTAGLAQVESEIDPTAPVHMTAAELEIMAKPEVAKSRVATTGYDTGTEQDTGSGGAAQARGTESSGFPKLLVVGAVFVLVGLVKFFGKRR